MDRLGTFECWRLRSIQSLTDVFVRERGHHHGQYLDPALTREFIPVCQPLSSRHESNLLKAAGSRQKCWSYDFDEDFTALHGLIHLFEIVAAVLDGTVQ